jgi:hypothetical protein
MPNVYIEARPEGRAEGSEADDFVPQDHADHVLATFKTQKEAIDGARKNNHSPFVARVSISTTRKSRITGAPPSRKGTGFFSGRSFVAS